MTLTVRPCRVEEVAAKFDGELKRLEGLLILRARPATHPPQPVTDFTYIESGATQLAEFHLCLDLPLYVTDAHFRR